VKSGEETRLPHTAFSARLVGLVQKPVFAFLFPPKVLKTSHAAPGKYRFAIHRNNCR